MRMKMGSAVLALPRRKNLLCSAGAAALVLATLSPALAERYGLVVGIDAYTAPIPALSGAVNDAKDIAAALQKTGVKHLILLANEEATKPKITAAFEQLLGEAKAGDTLVFSYAGHGSLEPAAPNDPDEPSGFDNTLPLVDYALEGPGLANRIVDKEVAAWLKEAEAKKVRVIFVADACHSGTMYRSISLGVTFRVSPKPKVSRDELLKFAPPAPQVSLKVTEQDDFTFLAGVADDRLVPEVQIDGQARGALSYSFARALEGAADENHDGVTTEKELVSFIRSSVLQHSDGQQISQAFPEISREIPVIGALAQQAGAPTAAGPATDPDVTAAIAAAENSAATGAMTLAYRGGQGPAEVTGAQIVGDEGAAELVYDVSAKTVEKRVAGIVAENVEPQDLSGIVAKWRALALLKAASGKGILAFDISSGPRTYRRGEKLTVALGKSPHPYLTLFNLPPDGKVEFLYPRTPAERDVDMRKNPFVLPLQIKDPPFGAEHLVAILSDRPLDELHAALAAAAQPKAAIALPELIKGSLAGQGTSIGIAAVFTSGS